MNCAFLMHSMCLIIFSSSSTLWSIETTFGPRRLIMLFDPQGQEVATNSDSFALMSTLIAGLEQQVAPILLSQSLWHNFVTRRHRYEELIQKDQFYKQFDNYYHMAQHAIKTHITPENLKLHSLALEDALKKITVAEPELQHNHPIRQNIMLDFICYKTDFNASEWTIRQIPDFAYILVPNSYEQQLFKNTDPALLEPVINQPSAPVMPQTLTTFDALNAQGVPVGQKLSVRELILGLKIDHFTAIANPLALVSTATNAKQIQATASMDLSTLFVTRRDLKLMPFLSKNVQEAHERYLATWNIYLSGHGMTDTSARDQLLLERGNKRVMQLEQEIKVKKEIGASHESYESLKNEAERLKPLLQKLQSEISSGKSTVAIAGLDEDTFKKMLNFFNIFIHTGLFFYDTCFGSGKNLDAPYQYGGIAKSFNYTIVSGASVDAPTTVTQPIIFLPPYSKSTLGNIKDTLTVQHNNVELTIKVDQNFKEYFETLEQFQMGTSKENLATIVLTIHAYEKMEKQKDIFMGTYEYAISKPHNIPLVRYPNAPWFRVIDLRNRFITISEQSVLTHQAEHTPFKLQPYGYAAVLLYTSYIPVMIKRTRDEMPTILSMLGGDADHYIEEFNVQGVTLSDVIKGFIPIQDQFFTKRFFIKKLICRVDDYPKYDGQLATISSQDVTLHNVVIINNDRKVFTTNLSGVNVFLCTFTDEALGDIHYQAIWQTDEAIAESDIPNLTEIDPKSAEGAQQLSLIEQFFKSASEPSLSYAEKLKGRTKVSTLIKEKAGSVLQKYAELKEKNPQGIATWLATLTPDERKMIGIIRSSETSAHKPTLSKKEFETAQKTTAATGKQPPTSITKKSVSPLDDALQQLERSLHNLSQTLR